MKLLPCPFCGDPEAKEDRHTVTCPTCAASAVAPGSVSGGWCPFHWNSRGEETQESASLLVYGDPDNKTLCVRGDIEATHWATIFDNEEGRDVVSFSDGTVLEFDKDLMISVLAVGPAFRGTRGENLLEARMEGVLTWVLFGTKTEMIKL